VLSLWCLSAVLLRAARPALLCRSKRSVAAASPPPASVPVPVPLPVGLIHARPACKYSPAPGPLSPAPSPKPIAHHTRRPPPQLRLFIAHGDGRVFSVLPRPRLPAPSFTAPFAPSRYFPCPPASLGLLRSPPCWQKPHTDRTSCSRLNLTTTLPPPPPPPVRLVRRLAASLRSPTDPPLRGQPLRNHDDNGTQRPRLSSTPTRPCTCSTRLLTDRDRTSVSATSTELAAKLVAAASATSTLVRLDALLARLT
jgi:hypothetical protein